MNPRSPLMVLAALLLAAGAASAQGPNPEPDPLAGRWLLTLPAGFKYEATLEWTGKRGLYRLKTEGHNLRGEYALRGKALSMTRPHNPNVAGLYWEARGADEMVLTRQPGGTEKVEADYRGAKLVRQKPKKEPGLAR